jgi:ribosomal protein S18 acetylase RimI-like enzyme
VNERIFVRKNNIAAWASYEKINIYKKELMMMIGC